ncbi:hypothetical protein ACOMHN_039921 [Nucella lapillus]
MTTIQGPAMEVLAMLLVLGSVGVMAKPASVSSCSTAPDPHHSYFQGELVNCSGRGFQTIPKDLPHNTTTLLLSSNKLATIPNYAFLQLGQLKELDLSQNVISKLQLYAFYGLSLLTNLSLWNNCLYLNPQTYPPALFKPLVSLESLNLSRNIPYQQNQTESKAEQGVANGAAGPHFPGPIVKCLQPHVEDLTLASSHGLEKASFVQTRHEDTGQPLTETFKIHDYQIQTIYFDYPGEALSQMTNLCYLSMDGLTNRSLGPGFQKLTSLTHLDLNGNTGRCEMVTLDINTLINVPTITHLNLAQCNIFNLTQDAFKVLWNLEELDLSFNVGLGLGQMGGAFHGLSYTKLTRLTIDLVTNSRSLGTIITASDLQFFKKLRYLERLQARFNRIEGVEDGFLCQSMPPNLKYINADGNLWELAPYVNDMDCLGSLEQLEVNGMDGDWTPPLRPPDTNTDPPVSLHVRHFRDEGFKAESSSMQTEHASATAGDVGLSNECIGKVFHMPPRLESFSARNVGLNYKLKKVRISDQNSLKIIDLSKNYLPIWKGPVCGFHNVTELYLMNTFAEYISHRFFWGFPSLQILNISSNRLRSAFQQDTKGKIFLGLKNLRQLDISRNNLGHFPQNALIPLVNLEKLYLTVNGMGTFTLALSHMNKLRHLDISQNQLHTIPKHIRDHLDMLAETFNVTVNMTYNPIACICANIDFLRWIRESKVYFGTEKFYYCQQPDGNEKEMRSLLATIADLEIQCGSYVGLFVGASAICIIFITMLLTALGYRFRWKLRYLYYASRLSLQHRRQQTPQQEFRFDAFISFSAEDSAFVEGELKQQLEENYGLRLCIHTRDFIPGQYIASNIVKSVQGSRRMLVLLTRALLASDWCHYELQMALMEGVHAGRDVLLFLLYENVPAEELSRDMLANLQATVYIEFPHNESDKHLFWARLAQALRE